MRCDDGASGTAPDASCFSCVRNWRNVAELPPRERILVAGGWRVAHAVSTALPGWLVAVARRHVVSWADLTPAEAAEFGVVIRRLTEALAVVLGCSKTYVASFGEAPGFEHLHVHVIPRAQDLPADRRGPAAFTYLRQPERSWVPADEMDRISILLAHHLDRS